MESLMDLESGSVAYASPSADLKDDLITSLTSFLRLYSERRDGVQRGSDSLTVTAARLHDVHEDLSEKKMVRVLWVLFGGVLGAGCGVVTGGVGGTFGAVAAATCARIGSHINAANATAGLVGSVLGGVFGGAFGGAIGGAVCAGVKVTGRPVEGVVRDVAWFTIGCVTGGAIGSMFGGRVGAAGGAVGGAFGASCATGFASSLSGVKDFCKNSKKEKSVKVQVMQKGGDFCASIKPLVHELKAIKTISDKMASSAAVRGVAQQTAKTLTSLSRMQDSISEAQRITDLTQFVSSAEEAARQSQGITEELEETKADVETLLASLSKH